MRDATPAAAMPMVPSGAPVRLCITVCGAVQGVGFRPHVHRLATALGLAGWVRNAPEGLVIEVEGAPALVTEFESTLRRSPPSLARVERIDARLIPARCDGKDFTVRTSARAGTFTGGIVPDLATCDACLAELFDPDDRRFLYPFINCTHCGPRYSILEALPYDRAGTTMRAFEMCERCRTEYDDPRNRRFHAQPNACPDCGPRLSLSDAAGVRTSGDATCIGHAVRSLRAGAIVAVKGIGGYQLWCDARNPAAVARLRQRKARPDKPFALMTADLAGASQLCETGSVGVRLLASPVAPIVLMPRRADRSDAVCEAVAPGSPELGVMLAHTPLHHLLLREFDGPVVATSGNLSGEPIAFRDDEALARLGDVADMFLTHDRPIARAVEDSVVREFRNGMYVLRQGRGLVPAEARLRGHAGPPILGAGAHLKNSVSLLVGERILTSGHLGDLDTRDAHRAWLAAGDCLETMAGVRARRIASDLHPDYASTRLAARTARHPIHVPHHAAHLTACMIDNEAAYPVLGVIWDGSGLGTDGTLWGGEFLRVTRAGVPERFARLRPFRLPGGEKAIREPRRSALGVLYETFGPEFVERAAGFAPVRAFDAQTLATLCALIRTGAHAPLTSSAGRLFDAVAALCGLRQIATFEGQAALELEWQGSRQLPTDREYPFRLRKGLEDESCAVEVDWRPLIASLVTDLEDGTPVAGIARAFHKSMESVVLEIARAAGVRQVALSGGCFQNRALLEGIVARLEQEGFLVLTHRSIPCNDGGISVGQVAWAAATLAES